MRGFDDIKLPDNIDEITNKAILRGEKYMKIRSKKNKSLAMAAALALVILMGVTTPVLAERVPLVNDVFQYLNKDNSVTDKLFFLKGNQYKYAEAVNQEVKNSGVTMKISEVVCDGANIFVSYVVKNEKPFQNSNDWVALPTYKGSIKSDFYEGNLDEYGNLSFEGKYVDEFTFIGMHRIDLLPVISKGAQIPDNFSLDISIGVIGDNTDKSYKKIKGPWNFKIDVTKNSSSTKFIDANIGNGKLRVNKVTLTPMSTDVEVAISKDSPQSTYVIVYDDKGNTLKSSDGKRIGENNKEEIWINKYSSVNEGTKSLIVKFVDKSKEELPVLGEFKIPIE